MALDNENSQEEKRLKMFNPVHTYISKLVKNFSVKELHQNIVVNGSILYKEPTLKEIYGSSPKVMDDFC
ncbi:hypothetical protein LAV73_16750 [Lysinibacillus xylanilyticus]|uniref:hypothetical protein n=1 Tax=Lysinibacillus xylanilyticus TaxID=582475 RepID=UPI002B249153|nr:hypothetical protein [Lysinibacillus xylanilyticus]MEB2281633.1 hypothetical protein [Lysinibacillus xylanilyticus]